MSPRLLLRSCLFEPSGYSDEARSLLLALERQGAQPSAIHTPWTGTPAGVPPADRELLQKVLERSPQGEVVALHACSDPRYGVEIPGAVKVARYMFETDRLPAAWLDILLEYDEVWVPCEHNRRVFIDSGLPEAMLRVVGETIDFDRFAPGVAEPWPTPGVPPGSTVFLSNFAFSERKAWQQMLRAWALAFRPEDPVCLVLKVSSDTEGGKVIERRIRGFVEAELGELAPWTVLTGFLDVPDMPRLYAAADVYLGVSRGEGWGRPHMEAMAMGLPTLGSRWGGNLEFMSDGDSWLIDGELVEVPVNDDTFRGLTVGHRWFEPDVQQMAQVMREIADDLPAARLRAAGARDRLLRNWGPEAITRTVQEAVAGAWERCRPDRPVSVALRGEFGARSSLSAVNEALSQHWERGGLRVRYLPVQAPVSTDDTVTVSHCWPPRLTPGSLGPAVAILPWEYGDPPRPWVEAVRREVDEVWVPSEYVRAGFVRGGMPPEAVQVVPNGVDLEHFRPQGEAYALPPADTTFLFVGGTIWRKGIDLLLQAWEQAFAPGDRVQLVIKDFGALEHYAGQTAGQAIQQLQGNPRAAPVVHLTEHWSYQQLPQLYRAADVLVHPYRGEGFGLPMLEALACGLPVIHTGIGPSSEFVGEAGWALPADRVSLPPESQLPWPLAGPGYVHQVRVPDLVAALREAADPEQRQQRASQARMQAQAWGWDQVAAQAEQRLRRLREGSLPPLAQLEPMQVQARAQLAVLVPDLDQSGWREALKWWLEGVTPDAPWTLALAVHEPRQHSALEQLERQLGDRPPERLPDLALAVYSELPQLLGLQLQAAAILRAPGDQRPEACFRPRRVLENAEAIRSLMGAEPALVGGVR